jgi:16S rRNA (guanine527-N7)-methyltransferase
LDLKEISELLTPFTADLSAHQLRQVSSYMALLLKWNARMNLTALRDEKSILTRHFGESFFLARHLPESPDLTDIGSGSGFPGIPVKIARPAIALTLVEGQQRKATFLREVLRALDLDAEVKNVRAETLPPGASTAVTLRAVEKFESILPVAARLLRQESAAVLALLVGSAQVPRVLESLPDWTFRPEIPIPGSQNRVILMGEPNQ